MSIVNQTALLNTQTGANSDFSFEGLVIRSVMINGEPWFVATDICKAIKIASQDVAIRKLDDDEKGQYSIRTPGGHQLMSVVNESGLYTLVLRCRDAVKQGTVPYRFRKWVTNEVLPQIRKTGKYEMVNAAAPVPVFRYLVELRYRDNQTGQEEVFKGGCNTVESIVNGAAHKFGFIIRDMISAPVNISW